MAIRMQQRRATAEQWLLADPVLAAGEIGYETDTTSFKIGDGVNSWSLLDYFETNAALQATVDDYIPLTQKGAPLGVAELDANGFVPASQLDLDLTAYYTSAETDTAISTAVSGLVDSAPGVLDTLNELAAAINDDADFATTITTSISSGDAATLASAQSYADQAELDAVATANAYTDAEIAAIPPVDLTGYATETYADQAEADAKAYADGLASNYDAAGSATTAESNANSYTDNLIGDATIDGTTGNTVAARIDAAVSGLVDSAPGLLDTLNEISEAINDDPDFFASISTTITTGDANTLTSAQSYADGLAVNYDPAGSASAAQTAAELYADGLASNYDPAGSASAAQTAAESYADSLATNYDAAGSADTAETNAKAYTDGRETAITTAYQGYADTAEADAITSANSYTDTTVADYAPLAGATFSGNVILNSDPTQALGAATKQYVDSLAEGLVAKPAVKASTSLNATGTYDNGTSGVGATFTFPAMATFNIDGVTSWDLYDGLLLRSQTNAAENGRYVLTTVGDGSTPWVFTRCGLCDEADEIPGAYIFVTDGTNSGQTGWVLHVDDPATFTVGTDDIDVYQFAGAGTYTAGNGLDLTGTQFSIDNTVTATQTDVSDAQTAAESYADSLATNYDAAGSADTAETNAKAYTDTRETAITTAYQSYADTAEADAISAASADATTKANTAETNAKTYTDDLVGDATVDGTGGNTITDRIATAVAGILDSAPATLDTLNELAAALGDDPSFATTVATDIGTKVAKSGDTMTGDLTLAQDPTANLHAATKQYVDTAEADAISTAAGDATTKANAAETNANSYTTFQINALDTTAQGYANTAESNANDYTDGRETAITTAYQTYADAAEADAISAAASDATTKANTAETNAENYTDNLIGDGTVDGTTGNTVTARIASAVAGLVDTAPDALNTLNELAAALGDDENFATTIAGQIGGKADAVHTHTLTDVTDVTATATELNYVSGVTSAIQTQLDEKADTNSPTFTGLTDFQGIVDFSDAVVVGIDALPDQTGNDGKYLTTDGNTASWQTVASPVPHPFVMIG